MQTKGAWSFGAAVAILALTAVASGQELKTGSFERTFSAKSPLTSLKALEGRLKITAQGPELELEKESYWVFVPKGYDASKPMGLIVLVNYKPSGELPTSILPQVEAANCAFVVAKKLGRDVVERAALALHVVEGMKAAYAIDAKRVYAFGGGEPPTPDGTGGTNAVTPFRLGLYFPDVFTGVFCGTGFDLAMSLRLPGGGMTRANLPKVDPAQWALAKTHPFVVGGKGDPILDQFAVGYKQAGFLHMKHGSYTMEQLHYPMYTTDWLPEVLAFLDETTAKIKPAATRPAAATATRPTTAKTK